MYDEEASGDGQVTHDGIGLNVNRASQGIRRQIRVLVVDDEPRIREFLQKGCETAGFSVISAEDGRAALAVLLQNDDIDIVVTDFLMPNMSGWPLVNRIWEDERLANLPIIFMHVVMTYPEDNKLVREQCRRNGEGHNIHFVPKIDVQGGMVRQIVNLILRCVRIEPTHDQPIS